MASVASQMIEEVTAHAQSDSLEDAREICADGTYFPNNLPTVVRVPPQSCFLLFLIIIPQLLYFVLISDLIRWAVLKYTPESILIHLSLKHRLYFICIHKKENPMAITPC